MMSSVECVVKALEGGYPDRTPVALHNFLMTGLYGGFDDLSRWLQDGEMIAEAQLRFWRDFQHDALLIENGVTALAEAVGCEIHYEKNVPPHVARRVLEDGLARIEKLRVPDPHQAHPLREMIKAVRICRRETAGRVYVMGRADQGPNALAAALRGPQQWILDLMDPELEPWVAKVLEFTTSCSIRYAEAVLEAGAHGTSIGGYGLSMLSPALYRRVEWPYEQQWCGAVRRAGGHAFLHICGKEEAILNDMAATGASCLELDPGTPAAAVRETMLRNTPVLGMLSPTLFEMGTAEQVASHVRETLDRFADCPCFLIGPGCALPVHTRPENIAALMEEVRRKSPCDGEMKQALARAALFDAPQQILKIEPAKEG